MSKVFRIICIAALLAVCWAGTVSASEQLVRVAIQPTLHGFPAWWDVDTGRDKEAGLRFELQLYPSGAPQNEALAAGQWDVGMMGIAPAVLAALRFDARIIGISNNESETNDIWVRPDSPLLKAKGAVADFPDIYGAPADWRGKRILVTTISTGHYVLAATLRALGLTERDVQVTNIEQGQAVTAFETGQGDIVCLWAPFSYMANARGWKKVSSGRAAGAMVPGFIVARKEFVEQNSELAARWLKTYMANIDRMRSDPKNAEQALNRFYTDFCGMKLPSELLRYEFELRPLFPVDEQIQLMKDPNGAVKWAADFVGFFVGQGTLRDRDVERLKSINFGIYPGIMERVKAMQ